MKRDLYSKLLEWKEHPLRVPLILKGARQVGKSWLVQAFGQTFEHFIEINFERDKAASEFFKGDIHISTILERLSLYAGKKIEPGKTLLFLDEIQICENALVGLRYFKEQYPELHVIAAGSLIDFTLDKLGMPVGRVQFMHLYPLSFGEFLEALGRSDLRSFINKSGDDGVIHEHLMDLLKTYLWLGGMPDVVKTWITYKDPALCQEIQDRIITAYKQDFEKYAKSKQIGYVHKVFDSVSVQLGGKFKYVKVDADVSSRIIREAFELLVKAGIVHTCYHTSGQVIPLGAEKNERKFKAFFFDIGLVQRMLGLDLKTWVQQSIDLKTLGPMAEQLVAQEIVAYSNYQQSAQLYYWHRESKGSNAEVDFLVAKKDMIIPIEVKANVRGGLKSLNLFLRTHDKSPYGIKVSAQPPGSHSSIQEVPLYGLEGWMVASD